MNVRDYAAHLREKSGQSLVELLLAIALGTVLVAGGIALLIPVIRSNQVVTEAQIMTSLGRELLENTRVFGEADWNSLSGTMQGQNSHYYLTTSSLGFILNSGEETVTVATSTYTRYFYRNVVFRSSTGTITSAGTADPSTAKITAVVSSTQNVTRVISEYFTRYKNRIYLHTDWSGGPTAEGPSPSVPSKFTTSTFIDFTSSTGSIYLELSASNPGVCGSISSLNPNYWAWNDLIGWIDFDEPSVRVCAGFLEGYASSPAGVVVLNCSTTPAGNLCNNPPGTGNWRVINDGTGALSGWAWNDTYGWISFCGTTVAGAATGDCPLTNATYGVTIDPVTGVFSGFAWNDILGWLSFNCNGHDICPPDPEYRVQTTWTQQTASGTLVSVVYDTGIAQGAQMNSLLWRGENFGSTGSFTSVGFQIAVGNAPGGPWNFVNLDDTGTGVTGVSVNQQRTLGYTLRRRYFRYKIFLFSDLTQTLSPRVDEVLISWSP